MQWGLLAAIFFLPTFAVLAADGSSGGLNGSAGGLNGSSGGALNGSSGGLNGSSGGGFSLANPLGGNSNLCSLIKSILTVVTNVGFPFAVFFIVYAGFLFVWARGNPTALEHARRNLMYTVIGLGIFFGAWLLAEVIANTLHALGGNSINICN